MLVLLADWQAQLTPARLVGPRWLVIEVVSSTSKRTDRLQTVVRPPDPSAVPRS